MNGLQSKEIYQDKEGQYGVNYPRRHTILNENVPNNRASNYMRQKLMEIIDKFTVRVGNFNNLDQKWTDPAGKNQLRIELN